MDKRKAQLVVLLMGLFGLGLVGAWGHQKYTQVVPKNQEVEGPVVVNLAGREIDYRVESRIPGVTATLSPGGKAWIEGIMSQTNYPQDKSFVVMKNGVLSPEFPNTVVFRFEPINSLDKATRQNSLYEKTESGGDLRSFCTYRLTLVYRIFLLRMPQITARSLL
jgi:hypothetical protein